MVKIWLENLTLIFEDIRKSINDISRKMNSINKLPFVQNEIIEEYKLLLQEKRLKAEGEGKLLFQDIDYRAKQNLRNLHRTKMETIQELENDFNTIVIKLRRGIKS